jgi:eukaryotic-like serine/threonine-protein kinase
LGIATWLLAGENRARHEADAARGQAEADKKTAQTEAVKSRQVTQFLEEMLNGVGPSVALGRDATRLREILDKTAGRIATELTNQPAVAAELRSGIGRVYGQLGLFEQAAAMDRLALAGYQKLYSNENLNVASSLSDLAYALRQQRKFAEAETDYRQALAIRRELLGDEHPDVAKSLCYLATVLWREGNLGDAETLCRKALAMQRTLLGSTNLDVAETLNSMAIGLAQQGKSAEAERMFREVLETRRKVYGDVHPLVADALKNLGNTFYGEGKLAEAEMMYRDALAIQRRLHTDEHPATLSTLNTLLTTLVDQGKDLGQAEKLLHEFLTPAFVANPQSAAFLFVRASLFARRGRWNEAEADAAKALQYSPTDHQAYHTLAPLLVVTHDLVNYQKLCQRIVTSFACSTDADIADRMAMDCLILPSSGVDLQPVGELAEMAVAVGNQETSAPRFRCCEALAEYRRGHFASAVEWARFASTNQFPNSQAEAFAILSMGQYKLNQVDAARTNLSNCEKVVLTQLPGLGAQDLGVDWRDWIIAHALLTEAQNLFDAPPAKLNSSRPKNQ